MDYSGFDAASNRFWYCNWQVFSLFLDALTVLIETHKDDLHENLYFIMSRLINKLGADLLGSVQAKTLKTLDLVR